MGWYQRFAAVAGGLACALVVIGVSVQLLLVPPYTRYLVAAVDAPGRANLAPADTFELAEEVRAYVAGDSDDPLPTLLEDGRTAFEIGAVEHLDDVRDVLAGARLATFLSAIFAVLWFSWTWRGGAGRRTLLVRSLRGAALGLLALLGLAVLSALTDFGWFFAAFHSLFFEEGTWQFPRDALLIRLFPEAFWAASGGVLGGFVALGAAVLGVWARRLERVASAQKT